MMRKQTQRDGTYEVDERHVESEIAETVADVPEYDLGPLSNVGQRAVALYRGAAHWSRTGRPGSGGWRPGSRRGRPGPGAGRPGSRRGRPGSRRERPGSRRGRPGPGAGRPGSGRGRPGPGAGRPGSFVVVVVGLGVKSLAAAGALQLAGGDVLARREVPAADDAGHEDYSGRAAERDAEVEVFEQPRVDRVEQKASWQTSANSVPVSLLQQNT